MKQAAKHYQRSPVSSEERVFHSQGALPQTNSLQIYAR